MSKRILVVGAGGIGLKHLRAFRGADPDVSLFVTDPRAEAIERAREFGAEPAGGAWDSLDLGCFDGVVICAPPPLHVPYSLRCLREGVAVLSEKPLSHTMEGVPELIEAAEAPGAPVSGVAYVRRYHPAHEAMREMLQAGQLGEPLALRMNLGQPFPKYRPDYRQIYFASREQGGGCMLDYASHFIDLAQWYLGRIRDISGYVRHLALDGVEVEDTVAIAFEFDGGALGTMHVNQFQPLNQSRTEIVGQETCLRITEPQFDCRLWRKDSEDWEGMAVAQEDYLDAMRHQAAAFLEAIGGGPPLRTSIADAAHTLELCLKVLGD